MSAFLTKSSFRNAKHQLCKGGSPQATQDMNPVCYRVLKSYIKNICIEGILKADQLVLEPKVYQMAYQMVYQMAYKRYIKDYKGCIR